MVRAATAAELLLWGFDPANPADQDYHAMLRGREMRGVVQASLVEWVGLVELVGLVGLVERVGLAGLVGLVEWVGLVEQVAQAGLSGLLQDWASLVERVGRARWVGPLYQDSWATPADQFGRASRVDRVDWATQNQGSAGASVDNHCYTADQRKGNS